MRKIQYPISLSIFESDYYNSLKMKNEGDINKFLEGLPFIFKRIKFKDLILSGFENLIDFSFLLENYFDTKTVAEVNIFKSYFDYSANQPNIANFFMKHKSEIELQTCFYCNIDFINSFSDFGEYENELHFLNTASIEELRIILGNDKAKIIYNTVRFNRINHFKELLKIKGIGPTTIDRLKSFDLKKMTKNKNHFTLDHFIPKVKYPYFALSLYNLIPSCYACNSKFKGVMEFKDINNLKFISPSSKSNSLFEGMEFKLYFNVPGVYFKSKIKNVNLLDDIRVDIENSGGINEFDTYLDMFKIKGRYVYHKKESLKLLQKRKSYSDSEIIEIAKISGRDITDIKSDIFGSVIFNDEDEPFAKYKRDIAKQLRII